jgi:hypothetical protein
MMDRTALLIRCNTEEADRIRIEAEKQRRKLSAFRTTNQFLSRRALITPGARTAILVRCSVTEAQRIREAARRRDLPINAFVLQSLKRAWSAEMKPPVLSAPNEAEQQSTSPG